MNTKCKGNRVPSDHATLMIAQRIPNMKWLPKKHHEKIKINNRILHDTGNKAFKSKVVEYINSIDDNQIEDTSNLLYPCKLYQSMKHSS